MTRRMPMRGCPVLFALVVLVAGCGNDERPGASSSPTTTFISSTTSIAQSTTITAVSVQTTPPSLAPSTTEQSWRDTCQDAPPPPEPITNEVYFDLMYECFHFWGIVETIAIFPYNGDGTEYGCTADFLYGTTTPMIEKESRTIHAINSVTETCSLLRPAREGGVAEVWTRVSATDMGVFVKLEDIELHGTG